VHVGQRIPPAPACLSYCNGRHIHLQNAQPAYPKHGVTDMTRRPKSKRNSQKIGETCACASPHYESDEHIALLRKGVAAGISTGYVSALHQLAPRAGIGKTLWIGKTGIPLFLAGKLADQPDWADANSPNPPITHPRRAGHATPRFTVTWSWTFGCRSNRPGGFAGDSLSSGQSIEMISREIRVAVIAMDKYTSKRARSCPPLFRSS